MSDEVRRFSRSPDTFALQCVGAVAWMAASVFHPSWPRPLYYVPVVISGLLILLGVAETGCRLSRHSTDRLTIPSGVALDAALIIALFFAPLFEVFGVEYGSVAGGLTIFVLSVLGISFAWSIRGVNQRFNQMGSTSMALLGAALLIDLSHLSGLTTVGYGLMTGLMLAAALMLGGTTLLHDNAFAVTRGLRAEAPELEKSAT